MSEHDYQALSPEEIENALNKGGMLDRGGYEPPSNPDVIVLDTPANIWRTDSGSLMATVPVQLIRDPQQRNLIGEETLQSGETKQVNLTEEGAKLINPDNELVSQEKDAVVKATVYWNTGRFDGANGNLQTSEGHPNAIVQFPDEALKKLTEIMRKWAEENLVQEAGEPEESPLD